MHSHHIPDTFDAYWMRLTGVQERAIIFSFHGRRESYGYDR